MAHNRPLPSSLTGCCELVVLIDTRERRAVWRGPERGREDQGKMMRAMGMWGGPGRGKGGQGRVVRPLRVGEGQKKVERATERWREPGKGGKGHEDVGKARKE